MFRIKVDETNIIFSKNASYCKNEKLLFISIYLVHATSSVSNMYDSTTLS